jgi:hypothetical protein
MSKCAAGETWADQEPCYFSEENSDGKRCIYYHEELNGHCDCEKAQKAARTGTAIVEEEIEIDIEEIPEHPEDALEMITSCATCTNLDSEFCPDCKIWPHMEGVELREIARKCTGFDLTASCVICKEHDNCHDGTSGDNWTLPEKINIASTCKKYDPITNKSAFDPDDIPF